MSERKIDPKFNIHKEYKRVRVLNPYRNRGVSGSMGVLTTAFLEASGISDVVISEALNTMEIELHANGLLSKMRALYPFVGGTHFTHKFNFMDARDLNEAHRLVYEGSRHIHLPTGYNPNRDKANTWVSANHFPKDNAHISYYSRTNYTSVDVEVSDPEGRFLIALNYSTVGNLSRINSTHAGRTFKPNRSDYFGIVSRVDNVSSNTYMDGVRKETFMGGTYYEPTSSTIMIGGLQSNLTNKECAFLSIGYGLSDDEALALYNIVQAFNTTLGREIPQTL